MIDMKIKIRISERGKSVSFFQKIAKFYNKNFAIKNAGIQ